MDQRCTSQKGKALEHILIMDTISSHMESQRDFFPHHPVQEEKPRKIRLGRQRTAQIMSLVGQNMGRWEDTCQTKLRFSCCREVGRKVQPMPEKTGGILMAHPIRKDQSTFIHRPKIKRNYPYTASYSNGLVQLEQA